MDQHPFTYNDRSYALDSQGRAWAWYRADDPVSLLGAIGSGDIEMQKPWGDNGSWFRVPRGRDREILLAAVKAGRVRNAAPPFTSIAEDLKAMGLS